MQTKLRCCPISSKKFKLKKLCVKYKVGIGENTKDQYLQGISLKHFGRYQSAQWLLIISCIPYDTLGTYFNMISCKDCKKI